MSRSHSIPLELSAEQPTIDLTGNAIDLELCAVVGAEAPTLEVQGARPEVITLRREGQTTRIEVPSPWSGFELPHRLVLRVPAAVRARVSNDTGRVTVRELAGCDLEVSSHAGSVVLDNVRGRIKLVVDSGSVKGEHLGGTFDIKSMAGSVKLGIEALDAGHHLVRTAMGSVKVELAAGQKVRVETSATLGSAKSTYPSTPDAPAVLRLEAELGSVKVREVDANADARHGDWPDWRRTWMDVAHAVTSTFADATDFRRPAPPPAPPSVPSEEIRKVLELLQDGKVTVDDAERLIRAMR